MTLPHHCHAAQMRGAYKNGTVTSKWDIVQVDFSVKCCHMFYWVSNTHINAGELVRFQAGVTMEISRIDAWYSSKLGTLETPATYVVRGLCRRCCLPEVILRSMQVSFSPFDLSVPLN